MAQQTINIGAAANDGTGDPIRSAFTKVNSNFTELYEHDANNTLPGQTGNSGKYLTTNGTSASWATLTIPNLSAINQSIVPDTNEAYDLGSSTLKFRDLYLSGSSIVLGTSTISSSSSGISIPGVSEIWWKPISISGSGGSISGDKTGWRVIDQNTYQVALQLYVANNQGGTFPTDALGADEYWGVWNTKWVPAIYTPVWSGDNLSSISITRAGEYPNLGWSTVNTDNMYLIQGGGDGSLSQYDLEALGQVIWVDGEAGGNTGSIHVLSQGVVSETFIKTIGSTYTAVPAPITSLGQVGDKVGMYAFDATYAYYCTANYDGTTNIWKRVGWSGDTW